MRMEFYSLIDLLPFWLHVLIAVGIFAEAFVRFGVGKRSVIYEYVPASQSVKPVVVQLNPCK